MPTIFNPRDNETGGIGELLKKWLNVFAKYIRCDTITDVDGNNAVTPAELKAVVDAPPGSAAWGDITGTLSDQLDLAAALDLKLEQVESDASLTGLGTVASPLSAQAAIDAAIAAAIILQGNWDADTNTPDISSTTVTGHAWYVAVAGGTDIGGITDWKVGDLAVKSATGWFKINSQDIAAVWGNISGDIASQTDLQAALDAKANLLLNSTTITDPAADAATSTANIDAYDGIFITLTGNGNDQTMQAPTVTTAGKEYKVSNVLASTGNINVNGYVLEPGEYNTFVWDGAAWSGDNIASQFSINIGATGLYEGGLLSINADDTKFDLSAGDGIIVDNVTDHEHPDIIRVVWTAFTAQAVTALATATVTYIAINASGAIVQQTAPFTAAQMRTLIVIGRVGHPNKTNVTSIVSSPRVAIDQVLEASDLACAIGVICDGNNFTGSTGDLHIDKSDGKSFREGSNYPNNKAAPNNTVESSALNVGFAYGYRDGAGGVAIGAPTINIDPTIYDDGSGVLQAVPNQKFTIQRVFFFPGSNQTFITPGQNIYNSYAEAKAALATEPYTVPGEADGASIRTLIILKKEVTVFADPTSDDSTYGFFQNNKFGMVGATASSGTTSLQQAYNNSSQPQIAIDSGRGAMQIKSATSDDADSIFEWLNNAGSTVASVLGNGLASFTSLAATGLATFGSMVINGRVSGTYTQLTVSSGAVTPNFNIQNQWFEATEDITWAVPANVVVGARCNVYRYQDATGGHTDTLNAIYDTAGGSGFEATADANAKDLIALIVDKDGNVDFIPQKDSK